MLGDQFLPEVKKEFEFFANTADTQMMLHTKDEQRFNKFVLLSFRHENRVSDTYLRKQLEDARFQQDYIRVLVEHYLMSFHLLELLQEDNQESYDLQVVVCPECGHEFAPE